MTTLRQAAQQALEALTAHADLHSTMYLKMDAITALRAALAEPEQEPVAWIHGDEYGDACHWVGGSMPPAGTKLYTAPPQRKPLTDEEIKAKAMEAFNSYWDGDDETLVNKYGHGVYLSRFIEFARAIEAAHGIKEKK